MNWNVASATKAILTAINGQPRCRANPVQTPPSQAPSATRVARGRSSEASAPDSDSLVDAAAGSAAGGADSALPMGNSEASPEVSVCCVGPVSES